jgi:ABC-2 type transport system ATP-binding protein
MILQVANINKTYKDNIVLQDLSFDLKRGECLGIVGKNGSGKSTLIQMLLNPKKLTSGTIQYSFPEAQIMDNVGVQFQEVFFDSALKVKEICDIFATIYQKDASKIEEFYKLFEMQHIKNRYTSQLSGGEKQKLNILLALLNNPQIVFFDELTTGLDTESRHKMYQIIKQLKQEGKTIIIVTHYYEELTNLADKVLHLKDEHQHELLC